MSALPGNQIAQILAQSFHATGMAVGQCLTDWENGGSGNVFFPPLGAGIKVAHGIQFVTEEFHSHRLLLCRGKQIHDSAADSKLPNAFHHAAAAVTGGDQSGDKLVNRIFLAGFQMECGSGKHSRGQCALAGGFPGHNLDRGISPPQRIKLPQPLLLPGAGNNGGIIQRQIPAGENGRIRVQEAFQLLLHSVGSHVVLHQNDKGLFHICT